MCNECVNDFGRKHFISLVFSNSDAFDLKTIARGDERRLLGQNNFSHFPKCQSTIEENSECDIFTREE